MSCHGVTEVNRRGIITKGEFLFDCDSVLVQALPPGIDFIRFDAKGNMTSSCGAMG